MHKEIILPKLTLKELVENAVKNFAELPAVSFVEGTPMNYYEFGREIERIADLLATLGLQKGDKVALFSHNMPNWVVAFFAVVSKGMVIVPVLPDFSAEEIKNVLDHSESKVLFVSDRLSSKIAMDADLVSMIRLDDFTIIRGTVPVIQKKSSNPDVQEDELAAIIYTSGTTGRSKGVMLTHKNITLLQLAPSMCFLSIIMMFFYPFYLYRIPMKIRLECFIRLCTELLFITWKSRPQLLLCYRH